jgi:antitoxin component YwqK of YwqJK toxin-antitoxin module
MLNTEKKGIFHGKLFRLDENMRILESAQYSNGLLMSSNWLDTLGNIVQRDSGYFLNKEYWSISKEFYSNHSLKKIILYQDIARIREEWFHPTGYKEKEITYTYFPVGAEISIKEFYPTGQIKIKSGYNNGTYTGKYFEYYKTGKVKVTGDHVKGEKYGLWIHYRPNGKVKFTSTYPEEIIIREY